MGRFDRKELSEAQEHLIALARADAEQLEERAKYVIDGRYKSSFLTQLEIAMLLFNKAVAHDGIKN